MLGDVPGKDLEAKLTHYIGSFMAQQIEIAKLREQLVSVRSNAIEECAVSVETNPTIGVLPSARGILAASIRKLAKTDEEGKSK
jgi:hypothetical protein